MSWWLLPLRRKSWEVKTSTNGKSFQGMALVTLYIIRFNEIHFLEFLLFPWNFWHKWLPSKNLEVLSSMNSILFYFVVVFILSQVGVYSAFSVMYVGKWAIWRRAYTEIEMSLQCNALHYKICLLSAFVDIFLFINLFVLARTGGASCLACDFVLKWMNFKLCSMLDSHSCFLESILRFWKHVGNRVMQCQKLQNLIFLAFVVIFSL